MVKVSVVIYVSGKVQGVGFRYLTQQYARKIGVAGYAYNMEDGQVEVVAEGEEPKVNQFTDWLRHKGPVGASITQVVIVPQSLQGHQGFKIT